MQSIGATAYRFSIAWPRLFPEGTGQPNPKGIAGYVAEQLGDRLKHFFTINEFRSFTDYGHQGLVADSGGGKTYRVLLAPALQRSAAEVNQVRHNAVLAHGLATQAIRARGRSGTRV